MAGLRDDHKTIVLVFCAPVEVLLLYFWFFLFFVDYMLMTFCPADCLLHVVC